METAGLNDDQVRPSNTTNLRHHVIFSVVVVNPFNSTQVSEFKEAFTMFNKSGDGAVSPKEIGDIMRSLRV